MTDFIYQITESEKNELVNYLHTYCDNPLATADEKLVALFDAFGINDTHIIRDALDYGCKDYFLNGTVPIVTDYTIWLNAAEIEVPTDCIPPECIDEFTIDGDYGYYYVGYGLTVEYDVVRLMDYLQSIKYRSEYAKI